MKISLLCPSRSRPMQSAETIAKWKTRWVDDYDAIPELIQPELIVSLDISDPYLDQYVHISDKSKIINNNKSAVQAINAAAKASTGDVLIVVSDDTDCPLGWNNIIYKAMNGKSGLMKFFDGVQKWICTMPVMTRDYYESRGYIYFPEYDHMFCDTDLTHQADLERKLIIRNDILFKHNHYSTKGGQPKDEVNKKADLTWESGERTYLQRCREKFGLGNVDIFNLSKEAHQAGHVQWLKNKLR